MALDWHILGPTGTPEATVSMGDGAHAELFARAGLHRPHHGQGRFVGPRAGGAADVVAALAALCEEAVRRRRGVVALAD